MNMIFLVNMTHDHSHHHHHRHHRYHDLIDLVKSVLLLYLPNQHKSPFEFQLTIDKTMIVAKKSFCFSFSRSLSLSPSLLLDYCPICFFSSSLTRLYESNINKKKEKRRKRKKKKEKIIALSNQINWMNRSDLSIVRESLFSITVHCFHRRNRLSILDMRHTFSLSLHLIHFLVSRFLRFTSHHYLYSIAYRLVHWWTYSISTRWVCWQREIFFSLAIEFEQKRMRISLSRSLSCPRLHCSWSKEWIELVIIQDLFKAIDSFLCTHTCMRSERRELLIFISTLIRELLINFSSRSTLFATESNGESEKKKKNGEYLPSKMFE